MKTLVFVQNTIDCVQCVREFAGYLSPHEVSLTDEEAAWRALVVEEMGGAEYCYLSVDTAGSSERVPPATIRYCCARNGSFTKACSSARTAFTRCS